MNTTEKFVRIKQKQKLMVLYVFTLVKNHHKQKQHISLVCFYQFKFYVEENEQKRKMLEMLQQNAKKEPFFAQKETFAGTSN